MIERCRTEHGCYSGATVRAFGLNWNSLKPGWPHRLEGNIITQDQYLNAFLGRLLLKKKRGRQGHPELFDIEECNP